MTIPTHSPFDSAPFDFAHPSTSLRVTRVRLSEVEADSKVPSRQDLIRHSQRFCELRFVETCEDLNLEEELSLASMNPSNLSDFDKSQNVYFSKVYYNR